MKYSLFIFLLLGLVNIPTLVSCHRRKVGANELLSREMGSFPMEGGSNEIPSGLKDAVHGVKMGISSDVCDNGVDNLNVDWDGSPVNYTCFHPRSPYPVIEGAKHMKECIRLDNYFPKHRCMNEEIHYDTAIPTHGDHRPLWPMFGEYLFVPPQRWLHNLEHGAIVMLYHPCAEPLEVERLRILLRGCLRKYIITPYKSLTMERPLALVAWGCKLLMNHVDRDVVTSFIKEHALHGPEGKYPKQGQYRRKLIHKAAVAPGSTYKDAVLCPRA